MTPRPLAEGKLLAPSILSADFAHLGAALQTIEAGGAALVHIDVMDGHFVPNLTIGLPVIASLRAASTLPFDVHLMIEEPSRWVEAYIDAGADMISVHAEADPHLHRTVQLIRSRGVRAGVAINPGTPVSLLEPILPDLDHVLVMSVNPGFSGQTFVPVALEKLAALKAEVARRRLSMRLEVDGGVNRENAGRLVAAGADILVAGSAVFGAPDPAAAARDLLRAMTAGAPA
jgi:ribulose-phosphate 3-epimerase